MGFLCSSYLCYCRCFLAQQVGTTGGEVRHTEIRNDTTTAIGTEKNNDEDNQ